MAICRGESCAASGSDELGERARCILGIDFHQVTADHAVRLDPFICFGKCEKGPNVRIDEVLHSGVAPEMMDTLLESLLTS